MWKRKLVIAVCALCVAMVSQAEGNTSSLLVITADTMLTEDHDGPIEIAADNVTLHCGRHTVSDPAGLVCQASTSQIEPA
jgi:hypothetical protein